MVYVQDLYNILTKFYLLQSLPMNGEVIFYDGAELSFSEAEDSNTCQGEYQMNYKLAICNVHVSLK